MAPARCWCAEARRIGHEWENCRYSSAVHIVELKMIGAQAPKEPSAMTKRYAFPLLPVAAGAGFALMLAPAMAQDAGDFAAKFTAAYAFSGYDVTFGAGTSANGTLTFDGLTLQFSGMGALFGPVSIEGPVVVEGVVAEPDGGYRADRLALPPIVISEDGFALSAEGFVLEGLDVPAGPQVSAEEAMRLFTGAATGPITLSMFDGPPVTIASSRADIVVTDAPEGPVFNTSASVDGIAVDLSGLEGLEIEAGLEVLGISTLSGSVTQKASWSLATGRMDVPETAISIDGVGTFSLSMELLGYTGAVIESLAESQRQLAAMTDSDDRSAAELAIGEETLKALSLRHMGLSFKEGGLVKSLITFAADAQGISYDEAVEGLAVQLPVLLMSGGDLAAAARAAEAASAFFADPKTLELRVDFDPPFAFGTILEEDPRDEPPEGMSVTLSANGIGPIPLNLEDMPIESLFDALTEMEGLEETTPAEPAERRSLPAPGADPRR
jgi:hypothetical protein